MELAERENAMRKSQRTISNVFTRFETGEKENHAVRHDFVDRQFLLRIVGILWRNENIHLPFLIESFPREGNFSDRQRSFSRKIRQFNFREKFDRSFRSLWISFSSLDQSALLYKRRSHRFRILRHRSTFLRANEDFVFDVDLRPSGRWNRSLTAVYLDSSRRSQRSTFTVTPWDSELELSFVNVTVRDEGNEDQRNLKWSMKRQRTFNIRTVDWNESRRSEKNLSCKENDQNSLLTSVRASSNISTRSSRCSELRFSLRRVRTWFSTRWMSASIGIGSMKLRKAASR